MVRFLFTFWLTLFIVHTLAAMKALIHEDALYKAVTTGDFIMISRLIAAGANPNSTYGQFKHSLLTCLLFANPRNDTRLVIRIVLKLKAAGADINYVDKEKNSLLIYAIRLGYKEVVELLLRMEENSNVNQEKKKKKALRVAKRLARCTKGENKKVYNEIYSLLYTQYSKWDYTTSTESI